MRREVKLAGQLIDNPISHFRDRLISTILSENEVPYSPVPDVEMVDAQTELYEVNTKVSRSFLISFRGRDTEP